MAAFARLIGCGTDHAQEIIAVAFQLGLAYAADIEKVVGIARAFAQHLAQRAVMKDDLGWHVVGGCKFLSAFAQRLPQFKVRPNDFDFGLRAA